MQPRNLISEDDFHLLERLVLDPAAPGAPRMTQLADRGLVWCNGRICTLSQAGWRLIRGRRWGEPAPLRAQPLFRQF